MQSNGNATFEFISTQKINLQNNKHFIEPRQFIFNIILDLGVVVISFVVWWFLWIKRNLLEIKDIYPTDGVSNVRLNDFKSLIKGVKCLRKIMTNLSNLKSYIEYQCGF